MTKEDYLDDISMETISAARLRIAEAIVHSELRRSEPLSKHVDGDVYLKLENQQPTGRFKIRGATNVTSRDAESTIRERIMIVRSVQDPCVQGHAEQHSPGAPLGTTPHSMVNRIHKRRAARAYQQ